MLIFGGLIFPNPRLVDSSVVFRLHLPVLHMLFLFLSLSLLPHAKFLKKLEMTATGGAHKFHFAGNGVTFQNRWKEQGQLSLMAVCMCVLLVCARERERKMVYFNISFLFFFILFSLSYLYLFLQATQWNEASYFSDNRFIKKKKKVNILRLWSEVPPSLHPLWLLFALSAPSGTKQVADEKTQAMTGEE